MEHPYHYRNKAQYPAQTVDGQPSFGFYAKRSHRLVSAVGCKNVLPVNDEIIFAVTEYMTENGVSAYDEESHSGTVRHLTTRAAFDTGEIMVCLSINAKSLPHKERLTGRLKKIPGVTCVAACVNTKRTNAVMDGEIKILWGRGFITDTAAGMRFNISPASFYQVNPVMTETVYGTAREYAGLTRGGGLAVADLYCGIGTVTLCLADCAAKVIGIDSSESAVRDARENAKQNGVTNAEFICGKAEDALEKLYADGAKFDAIVVDPARRGCDVRLLDTIGSRGPGRVVYISCDPASLARDVKILYEYGYKLSKIKPVDCFPFTPHVETVALLEKFIF